ncbi:ankyrin repeat domain-containing protein [Stenotrophomonas koreensis]|uniref:ankyrin repeat domain-containing protein n=1 Tax=Stenotrophomonas koreensis TaxID=266128 RepID=UPI003394D3BD
MHASHALHRYRTAASLLALLLLASVLSACDAISTARSHHFAHRYYQGPALQLAIAAEHGDVRRVQRLMKDKGVNPDTVFGGSDRYPLVAWPLMSRNLEGLRALPENGAAPNARYPEPKSYGKERIYYYNNAMVYAAKIEDPRFLELLLAYGGNPDTRDSNNEILMVDAFLSGNRWKNIQTLVKHGANINAENIGRGDTILRHYTSRGGFNQAWWLIQHGADPTLTIAANKVTGAPERMLMAEAIFWEITTPEHAEAQRNCQQWLLARGIERMPMPDHLRRKREAFGYPTDEADIPLL